MSSKVNKTKKETQETYAIEVNHVTKYFKVYEEPRWDGSTPYRIAGGAQYHQGDETGGVVSVKGTGTGAQFTVSSYPKMKMMNIIRIIN